VPKNGAGSCWCRTSERSSTAAECVRADAIRRSRQTCSTASPGVFAWAKLASAASRAMTISAAIRACGASAGISPATSWTSRATRSCRQAIVAPGGGAGTAASMAASRSALS
jgi:hypothetical protein